MPMDGGKPGARRASDGGCAGDGPAADRGGPIPWAVAIQAAGRQPSAVIPAQRESGPSTLANQAAAAQFRRSVVDSAAQPVDLQRFADAWQLWRAAALVIVADTLSSHASAPSCYAWLVIPVTPGRRPRTPTRSSWRLCRAPSDPRPATRQRCRATSRSRCFSCPPCGRIAALLERASP